MTLSDISAVSIALPSITVFLTFSNQNKTLKKLSVFVLVTAIMEAIVSIYFEFGWHNLFIFHFYTYFEVCGLAIIFSDIVTGWMKKAIFLSASIFIAFSIVNITLWESLNEGNSNQRHAAGIIIIFFSLLYFIKIFIDAKIQKIEEDHYFWFSSILLIYTAGTFFLFVLGNKLDSNDYDMYYNLLHSVLNILLNIGFTLTLLMGSRKLR